MDPMFHESSLNLGTPSAFQSISQQSHASGASSSNSYYDEQQGVSSYHNASANGALGNGHNDYSKSLAYGSGVGSNNQDTSAIQNFAQQHHTAAPAYRDATSTPRQEDRNSVSIPYDSTTRSPYPGADNQAQSTQGTHYQEQSNESFSNGGGVNFQTLLDNLSPSIGNNPSHEGNASASMPSQSSQPQGNATSPTSALPAAPNLPPRPPPQEKPATHPNYAPEDDIRSYHPHSRKTPNAPYRGQPGLQPLMTTTAPGAVPPNAMPSATYPQQAPLSATQSNQSPGTPNYRQRDSIDRRQDRDAADDEDSRWPPEINRIYEEFLEEERRFVTDGQWDQFPSNSRLFIGNLPTEKVTKRDIFHRFYKHGKLAQISIKQAYGFVQFLDAGACFRALQAEQGQIVRGRKMHLEISKPQRNTRNADGGNNARGGARRRSRSPDYTRGGSGPQGGRGVDRYTGSQNGASPRDRDFRRGRDDYRPGRSPSPRGGGRGGRNRDRSRDRYDGRRRSRSRSPYSRGRYRSPSPRRDLDDDLPLPRRAPKDVPDVQVIVIDDLPRDFIAWVERCFQERGLRCNVLLLSPRLSEAAVVRRQILEGVQAVSKLTQLSVQTNKIPLQVFDRRGGADNVRFEEYANLDPSIAAVLVVNAKQTHGIVPVAPPAPAQYGIPPQQYGMPPVPQPNYPPPQNPPNQSLPPASNANLSNLISSLDTTGLQQLLGAMSQQAPSQTSQQQPPTGLTPDLARLLSSTAAPPPQQPAYGQQALPHTNSNPYAAMANNPALASLLGGQGQAPLPTPQQPPPPPQNQTTNQVPPPGQPDMNEIMAQLAKYRR